jgi:hypothetical protein
MRCETVAVGCHGLRIGLFERFSGAPICHWLPPVAPAWLRKYSVRSWAVADGEGLACSLASVSRRRGRDLSVKRQELDTGRRTMKAIVVTDQAAGTGTKSSSTRRSSAIASSSPIRKRSRKSGGSSSRSSTTSRGSVLIARAAGDRGRRTNFRSSTAAGADRGHLPRERRVRRLRLTPRYDVSRIRKP